MTTETTHAYDWQGRTLKDRNGDKIGTIDALYVDQETDKPEWALVNTGLFGSKASFVPLAGATPREEAELFRHYGIDYTTEGSVTATDKPNGAVGHDTSGPTTDDAMTRSEEELRVGTAERESGRARLRKYVVTEQVQQTVPVRREEVRVEREPITDGNVDQALDGPAISEEEHEVVLHAEEPVVEKRTVPKERVRLDKETVTGEETVSDEVRKEQIEADGDAGRL